MFEVNVVANTIILFPDELYLPGIVCWHSAADINRESLARSA